MSRGLGDVYKRQARRYPQLQGGLSAQRAPPAARDRLRRILGLLALLVPIWSMFVLLRMLFAGNVQLMYGPAAQGVLSQEQQRGLAPAQRPAIFMLGLLLFMMMLVPVLNLLAPAVLCSSLCHLQGRGWTGQPGRG